MRPKVKEYKITKQQLDAMQIPHDSGVCIVAITERTADERTESGIYVVGDQDYKPSEHAERWGYVANVPPNLIYDRMTQDSMDWKTEMELKVGDKVWFDPNTAIHAYTFLVDGVWYKVMPYSQLYVANRSGAIIPLNGYVLFSEVEKEKESSLLIEDEIDKRFGYVEYIGKPNKEYLYGTYSDDIKIEVTDTVLFEQSTSCFPLEGTLHREFSDSKYVLQQRKRIIGVVNEERTEIVKLHNKVIGVRAEKDNKKVGSIELLKYDNPHRFGVVEMSNSEEMPIGTKVLLPRKKGTEFNELEFYTEDRILYYE